ncbi:hypothetical protein L6164_001387 [Bauhinia variegata]|uniref:Uncharacterized protein n=1 Tax=Bauhinia variegata TaxID=167791 RepID=A0ACB9QBJ8_BAUVA|nr:hypothetical protein L6164_001387 [Bauhinia variegata]
MISLKKLIEMAGKWRKLTREGKKKIAYSRITEAVGGEKGHFVFYSSDDRRFELPLNYLKTDIFRALFELAEEEFGFFSDGPTRLPREAALIEYAVSLIRGNAAEEMMKALLLTVATNQCQSSLRYHPEQTNLSLLSSF